MPTHRIEIEDRGTRQIALLYRVDGENESVIGSFSVPTDELKAYRAGFNGFIFEYDDYWRKQSETVISG